MVGRLFRKMGIGSQLLKNIEAVANEKKCQKFSLIALKQNESACRLYIKNEFVISDNNEEGMVKPVKK